LSSLFSRIISFDFYGYNLSIAEIVGEKKDFS